MLPRNALPALSVWILFVLTGTSICLAASEAGREAAPEIRSVSSYSDVRSIVADDNAAYFTTDGGIIVFDNYHQEWIAPEPQAPRDSISCMILHPYTAYLWVIHGGHVSFRTATGAWNSTPLAPHIRDFAFRNDKIFVRGDSIVTEVDPWSGFPVSDSLSISPDSLDWCHCSIGNQEEKPLRIDTEAIRNLPRRPWDKTPLTISASFTENNGNIWLGTHDYGLYYYDSYYLNLAHTPFGLWKSRVSQIFILKDAVVAYHTNQSPDEPAACTSLNSSLNNFNWTFFSRGGHPLDMDAICANSTQLFFASHNAIFTQNIGKPASELLLLLPDFFTRLVSIAAGDSALYLNDGRSIWAFSFSSKSLTPVLLPGQARDALSPSMKLREKDLCFVDSSSVSLLSILSRQLKIFPADSAIDVFRSGPELFILSRGGCSLYPSSLPDERPILLKPRNFASYTPSCLLADSAHVWIGTDAGLLEYSRPDSSWSLISEDDGLVDTQILSLAKDRNILYIATKKGLSAYSYE